MREKVYRKLTKRLAYDIIADSEGRPSLKWNVKLEIYINIDLGFLTN